MHFYGECYDLDFVVEMEGVCGCLVVCLESVNDEGQEVVTDVGVGVDLRGVNRW